MDLRLLGPVEAYAGGIPLALGAPRQRAVLAALLLNGNKPVPMEQLIQAIWDEPPSSANANIRTYVAGLRRVFRDAGGGDRLTTLGAAYRLAIEPAELDVARFSNLSEHGKQAVSTGDFAAASAYFSEALGLCDGPPLSGTVRSSWLQMEATRLEEQRLAVVEQAVDADLAIGRHGQMVPELTRLVAAHPFRERFWAQLMLALYRLGRRADALDAYGRLRTRLADELGLDPSPELQRLHAQLLRAEPALLTDCPPPRDGAGPDPRGVVPPRQLPLSSGTFTGRAEELTRIQELLRDVGRGPVAISAIDGLGGVGKSTLAIQAASRLTEQFPDGQLYVDLQGATPGLPPLEPEEVLGRFLRALGVAGTEIPANLEEMTAALRSRLAGRRVLLVLDNAADAEQVRTLIPAGKGCAALITSRRVLGTVEGACHIHLDVLPLAEAVLLLERLVGTARVRDEYDAAVDIAELCGRLPLALRIAGARLAARPSWSLRTFAERLFDTDTRLDHLESGSLVVRPSLRVSYASLRNSDDPGDQLAVRAFRLVGLLDGPEVGIPVVAALLDRPCHVAEPAMERLADERLIEALGVGRYRLHDLIRLFARELATEEEQDDQVVAALDRAMSCYLATAQHAVKLLDPLRQWPALPVDKSFAVPLQDRSAAELWLETERANLVAAVVQAAHRRDAITRFAPALAGALMWFLRPRMYVRDQLTAGERAIHAARRLGDRRGEAWGQEIMAHAYFQTGFIDKQRMCHELANEIWLELGDRDGEQRTLCNLAIAARAHGDYAESITLVNRQIVIAQEIGNQVAEAIGQSNLGETYLELGNAAAALTHLKAAHEMALSIGDGRTLALTTFIIGKLCLDEGRLGEARDCMEQALPRLREVGDRENEAELLIMLSRVCRRLGHLDEALARCEQGLGIGSGIGDWYFETEALRERGHVRAALGN